MWNLRYQQKFIIVIGIIVFLILYFNFNTSTPPENHHDDKHQGKYKHAYGQPKKGMNPEWTKDEVKADKIKKAFQFAWNNYKSRAMGHDNIGPISGNYTDTWNSWGITLVDSLDTLWLLGLKEEFKIATEYVKKIDYNKSMKSFSVFEIIIRHLGGLISAYDLSHEEIYLKQAVTLADNLLPVFNTKYGYPIRYYNYGDDVSNRKQYIQIHGKTSTLAEVGSLQLEFHRLSIITRNKVYAEKAQNIIDRLSTFNLKLPGLYPLELNIDTNKPITNRISFGSLGDSFYEYLLKRYILTNRTEPQYKRMYEESIVGLKQHLLKQHGEYLFLTELNNNLIPNNEMDHLACFVPGLLMLGSQYLNLTEQFYIGQELVYSCNMFYNQTPTGLGPEKIGWYPNGNKLLKVNKVYKLRPETLESIFYAYKYTGQQIYRDWAWKIFEAIEKHCKSDYGYSEYENVYSLGKYNKEDIMESFFLAETLKYLYLIFDPNVLDLSKYVLTTEAHPILIS